MIRNKKSTIRFDERTWMLLKELSERTGTNISVIIRSMVMRSVDMLIDDAGNWKMEHENKKD